MWWHFRLSFWLFPSNERRRHHLNSLPHFGVDNPAPSLLESAVVESTSWQAPEERRAGAFPRRVLPHFQQSELGAPCLALPVAVITPRPGAGKPLERFHRDNRRETIWEGLDGTQPFPCPGASSLISSSPAAFESF